MSDNTLLVFIGVLSFIALGGYVLIRCLRIFLASRDIEQITLTHEDLDDIREVLAFLRSNYCKLCENSNIEFSKAMLDKIIDLQTFFVYISNRPSVLIEVKKMFQEGKK